MATKRIPILGANTRLSPTTDVCIESYEVLATNDVWKVNVIRCGAVAANNAQPSTRDGMYGVFSVPKDYVGGAKIVIVWTATITSGDVVWDIDYRTVAGNDANSLDQSGTEETATVTDTAPGAAHRRLETSISLTAGNFAVDDTVSFGFFRDGTDGADTMAGSALLFGLYFEYTT